MVVVDVHLPLPHSGGGGCSYGVVVVAKCIGVKSKKVLATTKETQIISKDSGIYVCVCVSQWPTCAQDQQRKTGYRENSEKSAYRHSWEGVVDCYFLIGASPRLWV